MATTRTSSVAARRWVRSLLVTVWLAGCGSNDLGADAGPAPASTAHCDYAPVPPTAGAGGTVEAGPVEVGLGEVRLELPVGTALGGNTSRAHPLDDQGRVDDREVPLSGRFNPSVGVETIPRAKAVAIHAGNETVVIVRTDSIFGDDSLTFAVAERLGPAFAGKVIWASSHTHTAAEQYSADSKLQVGGGRKRQLVRDRMIDGITAAAEAAIADLQPAKIGIAIEPNFDPDDLVSYDRRPENDDLPQGADRKDHFLAVIRIDSLAGEPRAVLPIFGVHSAILDDDVALFSTDVSGMYERLIEEHFDQQVMAIHLQGAAGDVLASSEDHVAFADGAPRMDFAMSEANARRFLPQLLPVYAAAGEAMETDLAMEMVTREVEVGPDWRTLSVRDGALVYAPFDGVRVADRVIFDDTGAIASPIDEFNAPTGAGLCGDPDEASLAGGQLPGVDGLVPYHSCASLSVAIPVLGALLDLPMEGPPVCASTRTTVSALRLGDWLFGTAPGEPLNLWADLIRAGSPVAADHTIVLGYAQGHVGYLLTADDWLRGGFEPSINVWGPLEGEYLAERLLDVMALAVTPAREDAAASGADRVVPPRFDDDDVPAADPAPLAGTVPDVVPAILYTRSGVVPAIAQPAAQVPRVAGIARFVWIGEDPLAGTPRVVLEHEVDGAMVPVQRRSGRIVEDHDVLLTWTPDPLTFDDAPRTHYWAVEWQAVTWLGATGAGISDDLEDRAGVPLGRYRFRIEGNGYTLTSDPFEVVPGTLDVTAAVAGAQVALTFALTTAQASWRLLVADGPSNRPVPVARGPVTVELTLQSGGTATTTGVELDGAGVAHVAAPGGEVVTRARVIDRFGNAGEVAIAAALP